MRNAEHDIMTILRRAGMKPGDTLATENQRSMLLLHFLECGWGRESDGQTIFWKAVDALVDRGLFNRQGEQLEFTRIGYAMIHQ